MKGSRRLVRHTLRNSGSRPITGFVYNHNFIRWDKQPPRPDYAMTFAYDPKPAAP